MSGSGNPTLAAMSGFIDKMVADNISKVPEDEMEKSLKMVLDEIAGWLYGDSSNIEDNKSKTEDGGHSLASRPEGDHSRNDQSGEVNSGRVSDSEVSGGAHRFEDSYTGHKAQVPGDTRTVGSPDEH